MKSICVMLVLLIFNNKHVNCQSFLLLQKSKNYLGQDISLIPGVKIIDETDSVRSILSPFKVNYLANDIDSLLNEGSVSEKLSIEKCLLTSNADNKIASVGFLFLENSKYFIEKVINCLGFYSSSFGLGIGKPGSDFTPSTYFWNKEDYHILVQVFNRRNQLNYFHLEKQLDKSVIYLLVYNCGYKDLIK